MGSTVSRASCGGRCGGGGSGHDLALVIDHVANLIVAGRLRSGIADHGGGIRGAVVGVARGVGAAVGGIIQAGRAFFLLSMEHFPCCMERVESQLLLGRGRTWIERLAHGQDECSCTLPWRTW